MFKKIFIEESKRQAEKVFLNMEHAHDVAIHCGISAEFLIKGLVSQISPLLLFKPDTIYKRGFISSAMSDTENQIKEEWHTRDVSDLMKILDISEIKWNNDPAEKIINERNRAIHSATVGSEIDELIISFIIFLRDNLPDEYTIDKEAICKEKSSFVNKKTLDIIQAVYSAARHKVDNKIIFCAGNFEKTKRSIRNQKIEIKTVAQKKIIAYTQKNKNTDLSWYFKNCPACKLETLAIQYKAMAELYTYDSRVLYHTFSGKILNAICLMCSLNLDVSEINITDSLRNNIGYINSGGWYYDPEEGEYNRQMMIAEETITPYPS